MRTLVVVALADAEHGASVADDGALVPALGYLECSFAILLDGCGARVLSPGQCRLMELIADGNDRLVAGNGAAVIVGALDAAPPAAK